MHAIRPILLLLVSAGLSTAVSMKAFGWGFWAHKQITRNACALLPSEMKAFFQNHIDHIVEHSVDPDLARREDSLEQFNHYLDIDYYGSYPFLELPRRLDEAVKKFTLDSLRAYGLLPWKIDEFTRLLAEAFRSGDRASILRNATYLAHYVQDAYVPLHATLNYDGQLTGQRGLHRRFESDIPEKYGAAYRFSFPKRLERVDDPVEFAFTIILESYSYVDSVLHADMSVRNHLGARNVMVQEEINGRMRDRYTTEYFEAFHRALGDIPRRRMESSIVAVAQLWYTAWLNAGKPPLSVH